MASANGISQPCLAVHNGSKEISNNGITRYMEKIPDICSSIRKGLET